MVQHFSSHHGDRPFCGMGDMYKCHFTARAHASFHATKASCLLDRLSLDLFVLKYEGRASHVDEGEISTGSKAEAQRVIPHAHGSSASNRPRTTVQVSFVDGGTHAVDARSPCQAQPLYGTLTTRKHPRRHRGERGHRDEVEFESGSHMQQSRRRGLESILIRCTLQDHQR